MNTTSFSRILFAIIGTTLLFSSCSPSDDDSSSGECRFNIRGSITDALTGEPLDMIEVKLNPIFIEGLDLPEGSRGQTLSDLGQYSLDVLCPEELADHSLTFRDVQNQLYSPLGFNAMLKDFDYEKNVELCPVSYLALHLTQKYEPDKISYTIIGNQCDNPDASAGFQSIKMFNKDTIDVIRTATSSELSFSLTSSKGGIIVHDTTLVFSAETRDTTHVYLDY